MADILGDPQPEIWDDSAAPGGYVCAVLVDGPDGAYCGEPVESEPCPIHRGDTPEDGLDLDAIAAREAKATPGPWERGYVWLTAPPEFDANQNHVGPATGTHCCYCHLGEPEWSGEGDLYGHVVLVHRHRHPDPPKTETSVSGSNGLIVAADILTPADTEFIVHARTDIPLLREALGEATAQVTMMRAGIETLRSHNLHMTGLWRQAQAAAADQRARLEALVAGWEQQAADHQRDMARFGGAEGARIEAKYDVYQRAINEVREALGSPASAEVIAGSVVPGELPAPARRPTTPDRVDVVDGRTVTTLTVQRCCNGCGLPIGDATEDELFAPLTGEQLPDVRSECPKCSPPVEVPGV
jgi:hypothetical protein